MKPFPKNPYKFMLLYAWRNKGLFLLIIFFLLASITTDKLVPYAFSKLVGLFSANVSFADIKTSFIICFILMILCKILAELFNFLKDYFTKVKFEPLVFQQLNADLFLYLSRHSVNFFANNMAGALANKSYALANTTADFYGASLYYIFAVLELLVTFFMFLFVDIRFAFAFLFALAVSLAVFIHVGKKSITLRAQMAEARNKLAGNMIDALQNNFFVRIFNGFSYENKRALKHIQEETNVTQKSVTIKSCLGDGQRLYFGIFYILMLLYGFQLWKTDRIDNAQLVLVFLLLENVIMYIFIVIQRAVTFSGVIQEIRTNLIVFATPHGVEDIDNAKTLKIQNGKIDFRHITFGYKEKRPIFNDFSLTIEPKQKIGIVGMSGSGKSSLINLIQRFYDIQKGEITIDGQNISTVTQQSLHENISYIAQTTSLFERSVAENIAYGKPNATEEQIVDAAKNAYAHEFILDMPNKYNTILNGENQLSGGQKQRLSIARALLKNAPILILDEATSALDSESEDYIQKAIEKMIQNKTVIAVAHRLSTLKNMDRIIVLEYGKIIEDGTPKELLKKKELLPNSGSYNNWRRKSMNKKDLSSAKNFSNYFLKPYYGVLFVVTILYIVSILCDTLIPWYISQTINLINSSLDKAQVYSTFLSFFMKLFVLTILARGLGLGYWLMLHNRCIYSVSNGIRHQLFNLMLGKNLSFWNKNNAGDVWDKIDLTRRTIAASSTLGNVISCCCGSIFAFVIMCYFIYQIHPSLMFIFIGVGSVIFFIFNYLSNNVKKTSAQLAKFQTLTKGKIVNLIANFFLLKTFGTEKREQMRLMHDAHKLAKAIQKNNWIDKINTFSLQLLTFAFECIVLIYAVYLWCQKLIKVGDVVFVITISTQFSNYLQSFGWAIALLKSRGAILDKNLQTFTAANEFDDDARARKLKVKDCLIEIRNLNFAYHNVPVLKNLNLSIRSKEKIGIVGVSGGGKTTLLYLLQRLINTPENSIFIDGQDITSVTQESLHNAIAFIPQDTSLFHRSIMENLKYGSFAAKNTDISQAAHNAFADVFIDSFPQKYNTLVGDKGVKLSGGERQRVGIARAFLKDSPILLLDEATSALDSQSEHYIQKAIQPLFKDKTVIVVAHRLSTLKNMDRIIVLDQGQIIEEGSLSTLLKKGGKFADLWALQKI